MGLPLEISKGRKHHLRTYRIEVPDYMDNDKSPFSRFRSIGLKLGEQEKNASEQKSSEQSLNPLELKPAMPELGTAPCPVCGHRVAVFVTRTKRPFINCGFCSARIFYNGSRSMELLKDQIKSSKKGGLLK
jgi:DNA-directed RNA polymerase subunit RPC12/RpoP